MFFFFFFSSRRRHTRLVSDWSSDVCSSDLVGKDNDKEPKPPAARWDENNPTVNYRGEKRTNQTHCSTTDPQAMLARKGPGKEAKLSYHGHLMTENRSGLVVNTQVTTAYGSAECHAGLRMAEQLPG